MPASFIMTKQKVKKKKGALRQATEERCGSAISYPAAPPRRSIPVAEVEEIVNREVNRVKAELTIYDVRSTILERLEDNEAEMEYLEGRLHQLQLDDKSIRSELKQINLSITRQLELDEA